MQRRKSLFYIERGRWDQTFSKLFRYRKRVIRDPEIPSTQRAWSLLGENCGDVGTWAASHADFIFFRLLGQSWWVDQGRTKCFESLDHTLVKSLTSLQSKQVDCFFGFQSLAACIAAWRVRMDDRKCVLFKRGVNSVSYDEICARYTLPIPWTPWTPWTLCAVFKRLKRGNQW